MIVIGSRLGDLAEQWVSDTLKLAEADSAKSNREIYSIPEIEH